MPTPYNDLFMRDYAGDTGAYPSNTRIGVSYSPDVIPVGPNSNPNYMTVFANNYSGPYNYFQNVQQNQYNYIYTRAYNLHAGSQTGTINLYYSPSALLLSPSLWVNNLIPNANGTTAANLTAAATGAVAVGDSPFYWLPPVLQPGQGDHYCLIAQVVTAQNPNPIPSAANLRDFAQWVADHPGIAWRNVWVLTNLPTPNYSSFQGFVNPNPPAALFVVSATCTNVPDGTTISLVCPNAGPVPTVNLSQQVGPPNQTGTNPKTNVISAVTTLPGMFKGTIQLTATLPSGTQWHNANIKLSQFLATSPGDDIAEIAIDPEELCVPRPALGVDDGVLLLMGDFTYEFRTAS